ncbi:MAG: hypothetical protein Q8Q58_13115 [Candidatus Rokubacteria bacterium]|nr:hypothetical protein [Candidatus Rokubacteria bacterium]
MAAVMLKTTIAGSLPKPAWLAAPQTLWAPWRLEGGALEEGKRDAVVLALREQEEAGIDIVTDGEQTRRHFVWGFVEQVDGIDFSKMVTIGIRADRYKADVPTVVAPVRRRGPIHSEEVRFARTHTTRLLKFTICTNCGMVPLSREVARRKLRALAEGAALVRRELLG